MTGKFLSDMRKLEYPCWRVEVWNSFSRKKTDLFNMFDYLVICPEKYLVGVQVTSKNNISSHRKKMCTNPLLRKWLSTGNKAFLFVYEKGKRGALYEEFL